MKSEILLYGNTRTSADMFYFAGVSIHDDFFCFTLNGKKCALLSPLEIGRARRTSRLDCIFDYSEVVAQMPKNTKKTYFDAVVSLLKKNKVRSIVVPENFPVGMFNNFLERGISIEYCEGEFFEERAVKSQFEIKEIQKANNVASACFSLVEDILRVSDIRDGVLVYDGENLTSEFLRSEIEKLSISLGADALDTIAASGNQACDPHEVGHGVISANSLIVFDIFPRLRSTGYFGDMTRTFLKGEPSQKQQKIVECVLKAQQNALKCVRAGANGAVIHNSVVQYFEDEGYKTKQIRGSWGGFFHSTGHGLGLDVHEAPSLGIRNCTLECGNVVTVEPGLYYKGIGGCRIEDNVAVERTGARLLSDYHYNWIID